MSASRPDGSAAWFGGGRWLVLLIFVVAMQRSGSSCPAADNQLTAAETQQGWLLLFDGKTLDGWMTSASQPGQTPVEQSSINPHRSGAYMLVHTQQWANFLLSLDFKITNGCNSGIFVRTSSLTPKPGRDVGFNGIEIAIIITQRSTFR